MIRLRQTFGAHAGRFLELDQARIRIGRMPDSEVAFDAQADLDASGRHAEIRLEGGAYHLRDVGSRNGTYLNGSRVTDAVLAEGDEIELGHGGPRLRVEALAPTEVGAPPASSLPPARPLPPTLRPAAPRSESLPPTTPDGREVRKALDAAREAAPEPRPAPSRLPLPVVLLVVVVAAGVGLLLTLAR